MAKWSSGWKWSDGTKWVGGAGEILLYSTEIDRSAFYVSVRITQTSTTILSGAPAILSISSELGVRAQFGGSYTAFIDRNDTTQRISVRINSSSTPILSTEAGEILETETQGYIVMDATSAFSIDKIAIITNQRSRTQPTG